MLQCTRTMTGTTPAGKGRQNLCRPQVATGFSSSSGIAMAIAAALIAAETPSPPSWRLTVSGSVHSRQPAREMEPLLTCSSLKIRIAGKSLVSVLEKTGREVCSCMVPAAIDRSTLHVKSPVTHRRRAQVPRGKRYSRPGVCCSVFR